MPKYFRFFFLKKISNNFKDFLPCTRKEMYFFIFFYLGFVWQKPIFLKTKTIKIGIRECLPNTPLNPKKPSIKTLQAKHGLNLLA
jgi:hypothetical protein